MTKFWKRAIVGALALCAMNAAMVHAARVALVIGNETYQAPIKSLDSPLNDAELMTQTLREFGFDVTMLTNATETQMRTAVDAFAEQLQAESVGLFFFAGHGVQVNNENYLLPVDRQFADSADVMSYGIKANWVLKKMEQAQAQVKIMLLDACRNEMTVLPDDALQVRGLGERGFAKMSASGVFIGYATMPGKSASGQTGGYGFMTKHFVEMLRRFPTKPIELVFKDASNAVFNETERVRPEPQALWTEGGLRGYFCFAVHDLCDGETGPTPRPTLTSEPKPTPPPRFDVIVTDAHGRVLTPRNDVYEVAVNNPIRISVNGLDAQHNVRWSGGVHGELEQDCWQSCVYTATQAGARDLVVVDVGENLNVLIHITP